jgi:hypothetical protein
MIVIVLLWSWKKRKLLVRFLFNFLLSPVWTWNVSMRHCPPCRSYWLDTNVRILRLRSQIKMRCLYKANDISIISHRVTLQVHFLLELDPYRQNENEKNMLLTTKSCLSSWALDGYVLKKTSLFPYVARYSIFNIWYTCVVWKLSRRDISRRDISCLEIMSSGHKSIGSFSQNYRNLKQSVTFTFGTHVIREIIQQWDLCLFMTIWNQWRI